MRSLNLAIVAYCVVCISKESEKEYHNITELATYLWDHNNRNEMDLII